MRMKEAVVVCLLFCCGNLLAADLVVSGFSMFPDSDDAMASSDFLDQNYGGEVQARFDVADKLQIGIQGGAARYTADQVNKSCRNRRGSLSYKASGNMKDYTLGAEIIRDFGNFEILAGANYHMPDVDTTEQLTINRRHGKTCTMTRDGADIEDFWTAHVGGNVKIPLGGLTALVGGGYQWDLEKDQRLMQGAYVKAGLVIPL